jgi:hypothetical protein
MSPRASSSIETGLLWSLWRFIMVPRLPMLFMLWLLFPPLPPRRNSFVPLPEPPRWKILLPLPLPLPPRFQSLLLRLVPRRGSRRPSWSSTAVARWFRLAFAAAMLLVAADADCVRRVPRCFGSRVEEASARNRS